VRYPDAVTDSSTIPGPAPEGPRLPPGDAPAAERRCEACGELLGAGQRPGAKYHGGACRAAGTRARRRAAVIARLETIVVEVAALRDEVSRW
jgi:hypothetical protein